MPTAEDGCATRFLKIRVIRVHPRQAFRSPKAKGRRRPGSPHACCWRMGWWRATLPHTLACSRVPRQLPLLGWSSIGPAGLNLRRLAGVSVAGARSRNPERSEGSLPANKKTALIAECGSWLFYAGDDLRSHTLSRAVPSALRGLTSVFGMGTGVAPAV